MSLTSAEAQSTNFVLGATALLVGSAEGTNSVVLGVTPTNGTWINTANTNWLHLSPANQSGIGSTNVVFNYDANPGTTRSGTLSIAGQILTVTQAGATYVEIGSVTTLAHWGIPFGVGVDSAGNVYITDVGNGTLAEWTASSNTLLTLVSSGLSYPVGVAVDADGNVYIADVLANAIKKWTATNSTLTTLISSGLNSPQGVAVDGNGNLYIADTGNAAIKEWTPVDQSLTTLVSSGLSQPASVAVDAAGNVYIADQGNIAIAIWTRGNNTLTTLVSSGLSMPVGVAVDGAGNVYIADLGKRTIDAWTATDGNLTTLLSGLPTPVSVAVDAGGNVYIADFYNNAVDKLPHVFIDPTPKLESPAAGNDSLPSVLPVAANLLPPFAPSSDASWLTITAVTNGVVSFSFTTNSGPNRVGHITLLGQVIPIVQVSLASPPVLTVVPAVNGMFLAFGTPESSFTVLFATNLIMPVSDWTILGTASNIGPSLFEFTDTNVPSYSQGFYRVRSP
jgi:DNA-binding beta-propeller fold protein YncE